MSTKTATGSAERGRGESGEGGLVEVVTVIIAGQRLGIPVLMVDDVLGARNITRVPLAASAIAGVLNLRGRIVTAIDVRRRLGLEPAEDQSKSMSVVVEHNGESYSLLVDEVGEVLAIDPAKCHPNPPTLSEHWRSVSRGIYRMDDKLLVLLDVQSLLSLSAMAA